MIDQDEDRQRMLRWTKNHRMEIIQNDDVNRHLRFTKSGIDHQFNILTWPGRLCYTGDMGTYVFARTFDMFEFFAPYHGGDWTQTIDYRYWAERCLAGDRSADITEYDGDSLKAAALRAFMERRHEFRDGGYLKEAWESFRFDVLENLSYDDESDDIALVMNWFSGGYDYSSSDFYEYGPFRRHTHRFRQACWAIRWAIEAYNRGSTPKERGERHYAQILRGAL